jgi:hypothetical protein
MWYLNYLPCGGYDIAALACANARPVAVAAETRAIALDVLWFAVTRRLTSFYSSENVMVAMAMRSAIVPAAPSA